MQTASYVYYPLDKLCCDREFIERKTGLTNESTTPKTEQQIQRDYKEITRLTIDHESRNDIYILHLFAHVTLDQPELAQKYGLFLSTGSLRSDFYPRVKNMTTAACGKRKT